MTENKVVAAFSADQVSMLTGLTMRQLAYWDRIGFFRPQYAAENRRSPYSRIYSFSDLVGLRTISVLKNVFKVSMSHLKEAAAKLSKTTDRPWSELKMTVWNGEISWLEPGADVPVGVIFGQKALFRLVDVIDDMRAAVASLRWRSPEEVGNIVRRRNVANNRAVFSGTRIPVEAVKRLSEDGYSAAKIIEAYPSLTAADVAAALAHRVKRKRAA